MAEAENEKAEHDIKWHDNKCCCQDLQIAIQANRAWLKKDTALEEENERLKEENAELKNKLEKFFHGKRAQFIIEDTLDVERLKEENTKQVVDRISVELDVKGARKTEYVCPPKSDTGADMYFEMDEGSTMDFILPNGDRYTVGFSSDTMTILGVTAHR